MNQKWRVYLYGRDEEGLLWWNVDNGEAYQIIRVQWWRCDTSSSGEATYYPNELLEWTSIYGVAEFRDGGVVFSVAGAS